MIPILVLSRSAVGDGFCYGNKVLVSPGLKKVTVRCPGIAKYTVKYLEFRVQSAKCYPFSTVSYSY